MPVLYGGSYDALAGQQQNYDNFFNAINERNRAAFTAAQDKGAEMAFRAREMANRDAANVAAQAENRLRFGFDRALQERARGDTLAAQQAANKESAFRFGKQLEAEQARMGLEREKFNYQKQAEVDAGESEAERFAAGLARRTEQLAEAKAQADAAKAMRDDLLQRASRGGLILGPRGFIPKQGATAAGIVDRYTAEFKDASKTLADAIKTKQQVQAAHLRDLSSAEAAAARYGFRVGPDAVTTPTGRSIPFTLPPMPQATAPAAEGTFNPATGEFGGALAPRASAIPIPSATQVTPTAWGKPPQSTGIGPAISRNIKPALAFIPRLGLGWAEGNLGALRGAQDLLYTPPEGSQDYSERMASRAALDERIRQLYGF